MRSARIRDLVVALGTLCAVVSCGGDEKGSATASGGEASGSGGGGVGATGGVATSGGRASGGTSGGMSSTGATSGAGGSGALTGSGGSAGRAGASGAGGAAGAGGVQAVGQRCAPGVTDESPYPFTIDNCYNWDDSHEGIPNFRRTSLRSIELPEPTVAGQNYALSLGFEYGSEDATIELWGSDPDCGDVDELLWWGPMRGGEICAEFRSDTSYTHLMMVWRAQWGEVGAAHESITFCPTGTCGSARDGQGLGVDATALDAPIGAFRVNAGLREGVLDFSAKVGHGRMHVKGQESVALGGTVPVDTGYFRMHASEPFDDAWYCTGAGSTFSWIADERVHFDFAGVTRLADCVGATGAGTATFTTGAGTNNTLIDSSVVELASSAARWTSNGCFEQGTAGPCAIVYTYDDGRPDVRIHAYQAAEVRTVGTDTVQDFVDTAIIIMPSGYGSPMLACAGAGSATFGADGSLTIELSQISEFNTCPGDAVSPSIFSGDLEFL